MSIVTKLLSQVWDHARERLSPAEYEALLPLVPYREGIPRHIYQTTYTKALPKEIQASIEEMMKGNPDWEHHLFDDQDIEDFILEHYGEKILGYYLRISPSYGAARADFFRYLLMYRLGGVYVDIKTCVRGHLDDLLRPDDSFLISYWDNEPGDLHEGQTFVCELDHIPRGEYVQWCIISSEGHPLMRAVLLRVMRIMDEYNPYHTGMGFMGTIRTTGPAPYTLAIEEAIKQGEHRYRWVSFAKDLQIQYSIYETGKRSLNHKKILKTDYHKGRVPVISSRKAWVQRITETYTGLLAKYRQMRVRENDSSIKD